MNKKIIFLVACLLGLAGNVAAQKPDHRWFSEARFGLFVHFGPYSQLCEGEWVMNTRGYTVSDYQKLQSLFNPQLFDAKAWVAAAKGAGMKYITFTSRHHDGFSNWDTKQSGWNIMRTPYGKDLVRQLADECHREGIKLVLYYSLLDWSRNDYSFTTGRTGQKSGRTEQGKWEDYIAFMKAQLTELLTSYGDVAGIWFDGEWDQMKSEQEAKHLTHDSSKVDWHFGEIYDLIHQLQPSCMVANNHHLEALPGEDYQAFEKDLPGENVGGGFSAHQKVSLQLPLETCETMNHSWGYSLRDNSYKSFDQLVALLVRAAGYNANLLLNVGPKPTGVFDDTCLVRLRQLGEWTKLYGHTIYGTQGGFVKPQPWGAVTQNGKLCYVHVLDKNVRELQLKFPAKIKSAKWLNANAGAASPQLKLDKKTGITTFTLGGLPEGPDAILCVETN
ncbi:MAG: alpha-L-fucosidase [Prevotellaceae bacterium]|jgi:alpha-L-fucosidase|nr:alpha-L-fucosidase [Prevotellaceae bacterium]